MGTDSILCKARTDAVSRPGAERNESERMSAETFFCLETFRLENFRLWEEFFISVKGINLHDNGNSRRDFVSAQFRVFTRLPCYAGDGGIKSEGFFDAALEIFHLSSIFRCTRTVRIAKNFINFFSRQFLGNIYVVLEKSTTDIH